MRRTILEVLRAWLCRPPAAASLGREAESLAARRLVRSGCKLLDRNYRTRWGELDLVMLDRGVVVFVEVKARTRSGFGGPEAAVGPAKRRRIIRSAQVYLRTKRLEGLPARFDVVCVEAGEVRRIQDAFSAGA